MTISSHYIFTLDKEKINIFFLNRINHRVIFFQFFKIIRSKKLRDYCRHVKKIFCKIILNDLRGRGGAPTSTQFPTRTALIRLKFSVTVQLDDTFRREGGGEGKWWLSVDEFIVENI